MGVGLGAVVGCAVGVGAGVDVGATVGVGVGGAVTRSGSALDEHPAANNATVTPAITQNRNGARLASATTRRYLRLPGTRAQAPVSV